VKGKKEDKMLRALFRQKLENAEVSPSPGFSTELMRKLRRREFLHFNPTRFNIWYGAVIAVTGTAVAFLLFSRSTNNEKILPEPLPVYENYSMNKDNLKRSNENLPVEDIQRTDSNLNQQEPSINPGYSGSKNTTFKNISTKAHKPDEKSVNAVNSLPNKSVIPDPIVEKGALQGIIKMSDYSIETSVTEGCSPLKVRFKSVTPLSDSCLWNFGDGGFSNLKTPEWLYDVPGDYKVSLEVFGPAGIQSVSTIEINVFSKPEARFEISPENAVLPNDEITFRNFSTDAIKFRWNFGDGGSSALFEPKYTYKNFGHYDVSLIAISEHGCKDSVIVQNAFSGSGYFIDFPNAFIPNPMGPSSGYYSQKSDESSLVFHPVFNGVSDYQLRIFSRRGILIFESNDINIGWDGYFKGQLSEPGVYVWKVRGNFMNGEQFTKMGDVTLLKN
jgi:PKD repeat protein